MIIDLHCHFSGVPGATPEERIAHLLEYADRQGIDMVCIYMGMTWLRVPKPDELRKQNDQVLEALKHWGQRAVGFVYLNPHYVKESLAELDRCVANGPMVGVKLWVARKFGEEEIDPIVKRATELKVPIFQHTWYKTGGNDPGESTPEDVAAVAERNPNAILICGHTGGQWEHGIRVIRKYENVYADLAGSDPTAGFTEMAVRELGFYRVLYGSDAGGRSFASQMAKVVGAKISDFAKTQILGENLRRLLKPICDAKGVRL